MAEIDQKHNFYRFRCSRAEGCSVLYASCQLRLREIGAGVAFASQKWPECVSPGCPAAKMMSEEICSGMTLYYRDRDDAGVGIVSRKDMGLPERTAAERDFHHLIAKNIGIEVDERKEAPRVEYQGLQRDGVKRAAKAAPPAPPEPIPVVSAFDLGSLINAEMRAA